MLQRGQHRPPKFRDDLLQFWHDHSAEHGIPPTIREAQAKFAVPSTSTVLYHLDKLVREGKLRRVPHAQHAYRLPREAA